MAADEHISGLQFAGTYHVTDDRDEYDHGPAEWLATGDPKKPLKWAREERSA